MKVTNRVTPQFKWMIFFLVAMCSPASNMLVYLYNSYYDLIQVYFDVSSARMGLLGTVGGIGMLFGFVVGGVVSDRLSKRNVLLFCSAYNIVTFGILSTTDSYTVYLVSLVLSCIASGTWQTFPIKLMQGISTEENLGKHTGLYYSLYSITGTILGFIGAYVASMSAALAWRLLMYMYVICSAITLVLTLIFVKEEKFNDWSVTIPDAEKDMRKFSLKKIGKVLMMPEVWLAGLVYFGMYSIFVASTYAISMMRTVYMVPLAVVTLISNFKLYGARVILAPVSGMLIDKKGSSVKVIRMFMILAFVGYVTFLLFPIDPKYFMVCVLLVLLVTAGCAMQGPCWSLPIEEIKVPSAYNATAVGLYNAIGASPDIFFYTICGNIITTHGDIQGNRYVFYILSVVLVIGFALSLVLSKLITKRNAALAAGGSADEQENAVS